MIGLFQIYLRKYVRNGARKIPRHCPRYRDTSRKGACDRKKRKRISGSMEVYGIQHRETL